MVEDRVAYYEPKPGQEFDNDEGFDPLVHVELETPEEEEEEENYDDMEDEEEKYLTRITVPNLPPIWL